MNQLIDQLEHLMQLHGPAQIAVWLQYKDHRAIQMWITRKKIPTCRIAKVEKLLKDKKLSQNRKS